MKPSVRPHGISHQSFLVYLPDLHAWVTIAIWTLLPLASSSARRALYQVPVRQATISLSLLLACLSRDKPWESLWGVVGNYAPCGISPQTDGMPVILITTTGLAGGLLSPIRACYQRWGLKTHRKNSPAALSFTYRGPWPQFICSLLLAHP